MFFSFGFLFECNNTMDNEMFLLLYLIPFSCFTHLSFLFHEATDILRFNAVFFYDCIEYGFCFAHTLVK